MKNEPRNIEVWGDWLELKGLTRLGSLHVLPGRGKEIFAFEYDATWVRHPQRANLDPQLTLHQGRQYGPEDAASFRVFLDSAPDRWGRTLLNRREAQAARAAGRKERKLLESDYLLGVYDGHRLGGLRFRLGANSPFLDDNAEFAAPPWAALRTLQDASLQLQRDGAEQRRDYPKWLRLLLAPGSSLGGARPKASVVDARGALWLAKFPSGNDAVDVGAWEQVLHQLAARASIDVPETIAQRFGGRQHTFLARRFDRNASGQRRHFATALTLLGRSDGDDSSRGASYLEFVEFLKLAGSRPAQDLEELWRRIVFFICVSNTDDHLRNHGFLLQADGWTLAPAYDLNPLADTDGLTLNISETDNSQSLELVLSVAPLFRIKPTRARLIVREVAEAVRTWPQLATTLGISRAEQIRMRAAFRVAES